jgi:hypothetical protein
MLPPEMYQKIIAGLEEQARQLAEQPQTDVHVALRQELLRLTGEFRRVAAEPVPDELKPEYGEKVLKEAEARLAALEQAALDLDKPPAKEPFVPWDGEKLSLDLVLALGYELVAQAPPKPPEKRPTPQPWVAPITFEPPPPDYDDDDFGTLRPR